MGRHRVSKILRFDFRRDPTNHNTNYVKEFLFRTPPLRSGEYQAAQSLYDEGSEDTDQILLIGPERKVEWRSASNSAAYIDSGLSHIGCFEVGAKSRDTADALPMRAFFGQVIDCLVVPKTAI